MGSETKVKIDDPIDTRRPFFRTGWADVEAGLISSHLSECYNNRKGM